MRIGPATLATDGVGLGDRLGGGEEIARAERRVLVPVRQIDVQLVAARFGGHVEVADPCELRAVVHSYGHHFLNIVIVVDLVGGAVVGMAVLTDLDLAPGWPAIWTL